MIYCSAVKPANDSRSLDHAKLIIIQNFDFVLKRRLVAIFVAVTFIIQRGFTIVIKEVSFVNISCFYSFIANVFAFINKQNLFPFLIKLLLQGYAISCAVHIKPVSPSEPLHRSFKSLSFSAPFQLSFVSICGNLIMKNHLYLQYHAVI